MDLFQLKCFLSIIDHKSFTAAAYAEAISQSSLSKYISKLEDEFHVKLFDRSHRAATLTLAGRDFERYARRMLQEYQGLQSAMKQYSDGGVLHVGAIDHLGRVGLTTPIASFLNRFAPGTVEVDIKNGNTKTLMELLSAGTLDLAFIAYIHSPFQEVSNIAEFDLSAYHLYTLVQDEYCAIFGRQHPLANASSVTWAQLAQERLLLLDKSYSINGITRQAFAKQGLVPSISFECDQVDTLLGLAEQGFGVPLLSRRVAQSRYSVQPVPILSPIRRDTVLVAPKELELNHRLGSQFVRHILAHCPGAEE